MFRHHNISNHYEAVALASLLQHGEEAVTAPRGSQKRQAPIARTRDKVQVSGAVVSMQAARHDKHYAISGIAAHPCKKRKDGAPTFRYGKGRQSAEKGWASPHVPVIRAHQGARPFDTEGATVLAK